MKLTREISVETLRVLNDNVRLSQLVTARRAEAYWLRYAKRRGKVRQTARQGALMKWLRWLFFKLVPVSPDRTLIPYGLSCSLGQLRVDGFNIRLPLFPYYSRKHYDITTDTFTRGWLAVNLMLRWRLLSNCRSALVVEGKFIIGALPFGEHVKLYTHDEMQGGLAK